MRRRRFAQGTASHGIGAAPARQESEGTGAFSDLAVGLNALATAIILPLIWALVFFFGGGGSKAVATDAGDRFETGLGEKRTFASARQFDDIGPEVDGLLPRKLFRKLPFGARKCLDLWIQMVGMLGANKGPGCREKHCKRFLLAIALSHGRSSLR
ncbi:LrgB family protein [Aurantimonas sp. E1-2-R+4]|uniref:LrgB family protein n=1 Tax=Aurantimonas sp. E1-2-R+4 TaxID=3113714 RepID=UPI002F92E0FB